MHIRFLCLLLFIFSLLLPVCAYAQNTNPTDEGVLSPSPALPDPTASAPANSPIPSPLPTPIADSTKINFSTQGKIVHTRSAYTYARLMSDIKKLAKRYPKLVKVYTLGTTVLGRKIPLLIVGNPQAQNHIWVDASLHAREYMTSQIVMNQLEFILGNAKNGVYEDKILQDVLQTTALHVAPMLNPDGVELCINGLRSVPKTLREPLVLLNGGKNFKLWKANINGVDLNRNFPSGWDALPVTSPAYAGYKGVMPFTENETKLAAGYLQSHPFRMSISYHCVGGEIYWFYGQDSSTYTRDFDIMAGFSRLTGYPPVSLARSSAGGGLKDFVVQTLKIPAITVELRSPVAAPIPQRYFKDVWRENALVLWHALNLFS